MRRIVLEVINWWACFVGALMLYQSVAAFLRGQPTLGASYAAASVLVFVGLVSLTIGRVLNLPRRRTVTDDPRKIVVGWLLLGCGIVVALLAVSNK